MNLRRNVDTTLLLVAVALTCIGVVMVYSSSAIMAADKFNDGFYFLKRQLAFTLIGFMMMAAAAYFRYENWRHIAVIGLLLSIILLGFVFVPGLGVRVGGALRWLRLPGLTLQPAELVKLGLVLYLAHSLTRKKEKVRSFTKGYLPYMIVLGGIVGILLMQPDLGECNDHSRCRFVDADRGGGTLGLFAVDHTGVVTDPVCIGYAGRLSA